MTLNSYDVIIIGSGISGLICANYLIKNGRSVILLEKNEMPGGLTSGFYRSGYYFESGSMSVSVPGFFIELLNHLKPGLGDRIGIDHYRVHFRNDFVSFGKFDELPKSLSGIYPEIKKELFRFFSVITEGLRIVDPLMKNINLFRWFDRGNIFRAIALIKSIPVFFRHLPFCLRYLWRDINDILFEIFGRIDKNPSHFFSTMNGYDNMKMLPYLIMTNEAVNGLGYPKKGFLDLSRKLLDEFTAKGGHYENRCEVKKS